jgi:hypothetical protein
MILMHIAIRALPELYGGIVSRRLETQVPLGFSLWLDNSKPRHVRGFSFTVCVSAGPELGGECGVGQLVMTQETRPVQLCSFPQRSPDS